MRGTCSSLRRTINLLLLTEARFYRQQRGLALNVFVNALQPPGLLVSTTTSIVY
jgi:hypothetical protein